MEEAPNSNFLLAAAVSANESHQEPYAANKLLEHLAFKPAMCTQPLIGERVEGEGGGRRGGGYPNYGVMAWG